MDDLVEYDEHDGGDDAGRSRREGAEEGEDGDGESRPARVNAEWGEEDGNDRGACTGQEKGEHPMRGGSDKREGRDDVCGQGNCDMRVSIYRYEK